MPPPMTHFSSGAGLGAPVTSLSLISIYWLFIKLNNFWQVFLEHDLQYHRFQILLQLRYRCACCLDQSCKTGDHQPSDQIYKHDHL